MSIMTNQWGINALTAPVAYQDAVAQLIEEEAQETEDDVQHVDEELRLSDHLDDPPVPHALVADVTDQVDETIE